MRIVSLCEEHLAGAARLEELCFSAPWSVSSLQFLLRDGNFGLVVLCDDVVAGYVGVLAIPPDEWEITNVAVDPDFRRRGMGEALMCALADKAAQAGVTRISLEVRVSNAAAIGLYRKLGFVDCGVRKNFYSAPREDGVIMEKLF